MCIRDSYLIGQRPGLQGYCGVKALCDHVVFKKSVEPVKYMPIDIREWIMNRCKIPVREYRAKACTFNPVDFNADKRPKLE